MSKGLEARNQAGESSTDGGFFPNPQQMEAEAWEPQVPSLSLNPGFLPQTLNLLLHTLRWGAHSQLSQ